METDTNDRVDACVYFCFILDSFGDLQESVIGEIIMCAAQSEYFEIMGNIGFMIEKKLIEEKKDPKSGETIYSLLDEGKRLANDLGSHISAFLKEETLETGNELLKRNKRERSIKCDISSDPKKNRYDLNIKFLNEMNGDTILEMKMYAPTRKKAEEMRDRFLSKPSFIITRIMNMFLKDDFFMYDKITPEENI